MSDHDTVLTAVRDRLAAAGLPPQSVYVSEPPTPNAPPPEGPWVVVPWQGGYAVGGLGRGKFAIYAVAAGADEAADLVVRLLTTPAPSEGGEYHRYAVRDGLSDAQEGVAAPWFEQPGGGAMVVLPHPIRWHVDQGELVELVELA